MSEQEIYTITYKLTQIILILAFIGAITVIVFAVKIIKRFFRWINSICSQLFAKQKGKRAKRKLRKNRRKNARDYAAMTPQERQAEFFNACWEEVERKK